eukprot:TRINITY_DN10989_c0_g1_i10.p1 TRINITY_DN10989_c0_g1~~TRINITY_DN10989_c0_g1_i10.p1  ORF type:complete len:389 (+),score=62.25 TRINITY_DN10989_c0_g1_i10:132-1169(+)
METCQDKHSLVWTLNNIDCSDDTFICSCCNSPNLCEGGRWTCANCSYNICPSCRDPPVPYTFCLEGHLLNWVVKDKEKTFLCEGCKSNSSYSKGRWTCKKCKYSICASCKRALELYLTCKQKHSLNWAASEEGYADGIFPCDSCKSNGKCSSGRWQCKKCGYNICANCRAPPHKKCDNSHPLVWSYEIETCPSGIFSCSDCHTPAKATAGRWSCAVCNFNVCPNCRPPKTHGGCNSNHLLEWATDGEEEYPDGIYSCDSCHGQRKCNDGRWSCNVCGYDICTTCRPCEPYPVCNKGHALKWTCETGECLDEDYRCEGCKNSGKYKDGRWACIECGYNVCSNCRTE